MSLLQVTDLHIRYAQGPAVDGLSFELAAGESLGLVGESGSGKSQTALAILGLLPRNARVTGSIRLQGRELLGAGEQALNAIRGVEAAMVFQDPMQALNPFVRIGPQLRRILVAHGIAAGPEADDRVIGMLRQVGLPDAGRQFRAYPHQLSGGMRQRVMIASALIAQPAVLIADEPTTALDVTVQAQILDLLEELRHDTALLLITHDLGIVAGRCERLLVLENGRVVDSGPTARVFSSPGHPHTQALIDAAPRLDTGTVPAPVTGETILAIDAVDVSYSGTGPDDLHAVREVSTSLAVGETVAIVGESGSGKSSLVRAVLGLVPLRAGRVAFCGTELSPGLKSRSAAVRRDLQLVFQDPVGSLNPQMPVRRIVAEPLRVHEPQLGKQERARRVESILAEVGLNDAFLDRFPHQLSGGQAQRVAIARALILRPKVLVCDEAVAALDGTVRQQILELLAREQRDTGLSILFISHDLAVVRSISHRVMVMYLGRLVEMAPGQTLFAQPLHPYTRALLEAVPVPDPTAAGGHASLRGEVPSALAPPGGCPFHPRCAYTQDICLTTRPPVRLVDGATVACHRAEEIREAQ